MPTSFDRVRGILGNRKGIEEARLPALYKLSSSGKVQRWQIKVIGDVGEAVIVRKFGFVDGKPQVMRETITDGKNNGRSNMTIPCEQAALNACSEWLRKYEREGYALDAESSKSKRVLKPMLAYDYQDHKDNVDWRYAFAQPKLDGWRCIAIKIAGKVYLYSRKGVLLDVPHVAKALAKLMHDGEALDGELYKHGETVQDISSAVRNPKKPLHKKLEYHVYDAPLDGRSFDLRYDYARGIVRRTGRFEFPLEIVPTQRVKTAKELRVYARTCTDAGYEGAMLRWSTEGYMSGKRTKYLLKYKKWKDEEFLITAVKEGRGKYKGCAVYDCTTKANHHFDCLAPGTVAEKKRAWKNWHTAIGCNLKVKFFTYTPTSKPVPLYPVAICIRDDTD